jgi:branched-chain amino acid transport system ATP-binding protein
MLQIEALDGFYGQSQVLHHVALTVAPGEMVALLGRNGSGRSSTARAIMGLLSARGRITWNGRPLLGLPTHHIARLGVGYVPETRDVFGGLTVWQNLQLGLHPGNRADNACAWSIEEALTLFPELAKRLHTLSGVLSGGEQQVLSLCRSLLGQPALLVLDEPAEGLSPEVTQRVAALLSQWRARGAAVLLIEQKLSMTLALADRCYVMGRGSVVFAGTPAQALDTQAPCAAWLSV